MALPKLNTPSYELEVPSTDEKIQYRPFLVKEEKILLIALESGKNEDIIRAMKEIVTECTFNKLDIASLPMFDVEYIFLNVRAKSVGEVSKLKIKCPDDNKTQVPVTISIDDVKIHRPEGHTNKIELDSSLIMEMKYPSLSEFIKNNFDFSEENMMDQSFEMIASCIDKIYNKEEVWAAADCTKKEISDFLESMNTTQFKKIEKFFETMPKLSHKVKITNPNTKVESEVIMEGLSSFFG